jgi:hypothetical protein
MEYRPALVVLGFTAIFFLAVFGDRWLAAQGWRDCLVAFRVRLPGDLSVDDVASCLAVVAHTTRRRPVVFEVVATSRGIDHYVLIPSHLAPQLVSGLVTSLPGARVEEAPDYLGVRPPIRAAVELRTSHAGRALATGSTDAAMAGVLSALYPLGRDEAVRLQWIVTPARAVRPRGHRARGDQAAEQRRELAAKQSAPMVYALGRVATSARYRGRARMLAARVLNALDVVAAPGVALRPRMLPSGVVARRVYPRGLPLTAWPCVFNVGELAAVVGLPMGGVSVPGMTVGTARQLPPTPVIPRRGLVVAQSNYPGAAGRALALKTPDRLRHVVMHGPPGVGKSTLIAHMAAQDINDGRGVIVIDPKTDLIDEMLARIPDHRTDDVIVIDASHTGHPIGFNILAAGSDEVSRELLVERVTHVFYEIWRDNWGPRTSDVIRACLLTLTHARAAGGSAFALTELPELLTNPTFRRYVTAQATVPESVRGFWAVFEQMTDAEQAQWIGPTMNKIRAILTRTPLRLMLGQSAGLDLGCLFRERKVILVPLAKGTIGSDAAQLLGSLLVAFLWQETLHRATVPEHKRGATFAYLDEFQEVVRFSTGDDLADMLSQARGLGLGLVLAHQFLDQLPAHIQSAVLGTVRTQISFQLEYRDARKLADRFAPMTWHDLTALDAYEMVMRPCVNNATQSPVTGRTLPPPDRPAGAVERAAELAAAARQRYGLPREQVEQHIRERLSVSQRRSPWGRGASPGQRTPAPPAASDGSTGHSSGESSGGGGSWLD